MAYGLRIKGPNGTVVFNEKDDFSRVAQQVQYSVAVNGSQRVNQTGVQDVNKYTIVVIPNILEDFINPTVIVERYTNYILLKNNQNSYGGSSNGTAVGSILILRNA